MLELDSRRAAAWDNGHGRPSSYLNVFFVTACLCTRALALYPEQQEGARARKGRDKCGRSGGWKHVDHVIGHCVAVYWVDM